MKSGFYMTPRNGQLSGWIEKSTSRSKLTPEKRSWSLFSGLLPVRSTTAFWIPAKLLHLRSMLSKLMRCTKNCIACGWHWSTERAHFFLHDNVQPHVAQPKLQKLKELGYEVLPCSPDRSPTHYRQASWQLFAGKNAATTSRRQKLLSKSSSNAEAQIFNAKRINKFISHWKNCVDCNSSSFD